VGKGLAGGSRSGGSPARGGQVAKLGGGLRSLVSEVLCHRAWKTTSSAQAYVLGRRPGDLLISRGCGDKKTYQMRAARKRQRRLGDECYYSEWKTWSMKSMSLGTVAKLVVSKQL